MASPPEIALAPGSKLGRYELREWIGAGGAGVIWRALDTQSRSEAALKIVRRRADLSEEQGTEKLLREAKAMARVRHPNVIAILDTGVDGDRVYIAMELVKGVTLKPWLREKQRTAAEILQVFAQAGAGLSAAHDAGVVHRDFKPENILIDEHGTPRILDFGLALSNEISSSLLPPPVTNPGALRGSPGYMAPEQHVDNAVDARADQYSFCVALYEALYNRRLRLGEHALLPRTPPRPDVPLSVHRAIVKGLRQNPRARFVDLASLVGKLTPKPSFWRRWFR
ncbi:MAG: serine/threonine-protein kinase [Myxococcaceae bacterium]